LQFALIDEKPVQSEHRNSGHQQGTMLAASLPHQTIAAKLQP
jgi:hypothetical protein